MGWKLLLLIIFNAASGKSISMFVNGSEPGMIRFTNERYLFNRDGKIVLKNYEKKIIVETSDDLSEPINPDMIDAIKDMLIEEFGIRIPGEHQQPIAEETIIGPMVAEEPTPIADEPTPVVEEPTPVVEEPTPVVEEPTPVVEEPKTDISNKKSDKKSNKKSKEDVKKEDNSGWDNME